MNEIITDMNALTEAEFASAEWSDVVTGMPVDDTAPIVQESLRPKFDSVAAFKLHHWTLDSGQDEECGNAVDGDAWFAFFRNVTQSDTSVRPAAILTVTSQGFVSAVWYGDASEAETAWEELEKDWAAFDDESEGA